MIVFNTYRIVFLDICKLNRINIFKLFVTRDESTEFCIVFYCFNKQYTEETIK